MLKWMFLGCFVLSIIGTVQAQLEGQVIDAQLDEPIEYVNVFIRSQKVGTLTDTLGFFQIYLKGNSSDQDSITFSRIGYLGKTLPIQSFNGKIKLERKPESISAIILKGGHLRDSIVGLTQTKLEVSKIHGYVSLLDLGNRKWMNNRAFELALRIDIPSSISYAKIRDLGIFLPGIGSPRTPFRVKLYDIDPITNLPGDYLREVNLIFQSNQMDDWFEIDLEEHRIYAESPGFYISMEWLGTSKRRYWSNKDLSKSKSISEETKGYGKAPIFGQVLGMYGNTSCITASRNNFRGWDIHNPNRHPMIRATLSIAE